MRIFAIVLVATVEGCVAPTPVEPNVHEPLAVSPNATTTATLQASPIVCESRFDLCYDAAEERFGQCEYGAALHLDYCERHSRPEDADLCQDTYDWYMDNCWSRYGSDALTCETNLCHCLNPNNPFACNYNG